MSESNFKLTETQLTTFEKDGYLVIPNWLVDDALAAMQKLTQHQFNHPTEPWELEHQLGYPGAPSTINEIGGQTPRRLLAAYQREKLWREFAVSAPLKTCLEQLFNHTEIFLSQAHHNCLMTKSPRYSSDTGWHQDSRYWSFQKPELITAWLALGEENSSNGGLRVIPGSHRMPLESKQFDDMSFFVANRPKNLALINKSRAIELQQGDLLFFHCKLLHSASRNQTNSTKLSLVFTYYSGDNSPKAGSRSARNSEITL